MAPADPLGVFLGRELRVVDDEVGIGEEGRVAQVAADDLPLATGDLAGERLMVAGIDNHATVRLEPVAQRQRGVVEVLRPDMDILDLELALDQLMVADGGTELVDGDREVGATASAPTRFP